MVQTGDDERVGLDDEIGDVDLEVIARDHLTEWERLRPFLGLSRVQKVEITRSYPGEYGKQKRVSGAVEGGAGRGGHLPCLHHCSREGKGQEVGRQCESYAQQVALSQLIDSSYTLNYALHHTPSSYYTQSCNEKCRTALSFTVICKYLMSEMYLHLQHIHTMWG